MNRELMLEAFNSYDFSNIETAISIRLNEKVTIDDWNILDVEFKDGMPFAKNELEVFFSLKANDDTQGRAIFKVDFDYETSICENWYLGYQGRPSFNEVECQNINIQNLELLEIEI